jgi:hypothetical protein
MDKLMTPMRHLIFSIQKKSGYWQYFIEDVDGNVLGVSEKKWKTKKPAENAIKKIYEQMVNG